MFALISILSPSALTGALLGALLTTATALPDDAALAAAQLPTYPLDVCVVSGEPLGGADMGAPIEVIQDGQLVLLCCKGCIRTFNESPDKYTAMVDAAVIAAQSAAYPLTTCPISGDELVAGETIDLVYGTRLVKLCCKGCVRKFNGSADQAMAAVDAAYIAAQLPSYPLTTCLVSDEELGKGSVDLLYGTQLVRLCCKACVGDFKAAPAKYLSALRATPAKPRGEQAERAPRGDGDGDGHDHGGGHGDDDGHDHGETGGR